MKKLFTKLIALMIIFIMSSGMVTFADEKPITVFLNGEQLVFDVQPALESGRTLVPMRVIFEALGAEVTWDNDTFTAIAVKDDTTIKITIDDMKLYKNDEVIELDVPARLIDGRTLVPVRAVSEGMDAKVDWDNENWKVIITTSEKTEYNFNELSPADKKLLDDTALDMRYAIEQYALPEMFATEEGMNKMIKNKDDYIPETVKTGWDYTWLGLIMDIQMNSEDIYNVNYENMETDDVETEFYNLLEKLGYNNENFFETEFLKTNGGNTVFLMSFKESANPTHVVCRYIGVTVDKKNNVRYFTAEWNPILGGEIHFMCEIIHDTNTRGTYYEIPKTKEDFLNAIDDVLKNNPQFSTSLVRS